MKDSFLGIMAIGIMLFVIAFPINAWAQEDPPECTIELNFVLLHGMGGSKESMENLEDALEDKVGEEAIRYEKDHPDIDIIINFLRKDYPNNVGVDKWAGNIGEKIDTHWPNKRNLILVGHSMGGKAALYAVAKNKGGLQHKTLAVVTINSPIRDLFTYGWHDVYYECKAANWLGIRFDDGICHSIVYRDTRTEADWVGDNKHWLAFISSEDHPNHGKCDLVGADIYGKYMDDAYVPIGAQYTAHADAIYYGSHCHSECTNNPSVADKLAKSIADYIFGNEIGFSAYVGSYWNSRKSPFGVGINHYEHEAGPNPCPGDAERDHYEIEVSHESDIGTGIDWARWDSSNNHDCRVRISSWVTMATFIRTWIGFTTNVYKKEIRQVCLIDEIISDITLCGEIWDGNGGPLVGKCYLVTCNVVVPKDKTLTIEPGVKIYFRPGFKITVNGMLNANGNLDNPIYLTSGGDVGHCNEMKLNCGLRLQNGGSSN